MPEYVFIGEAGKAAQEAAAPQPFVERIGSLTGSVQHTLNDATEVADQLRGRLFGEWPRGIAGGTDNAKIEAMPPATVRAAQDLAQLLETAVRLADTINFINARL